MDGGNSGSILATLCFESFYSQIESKAISKAKHAAGQMNDSF